MKTIMVFTDFSAPADHAAHFAVRLAWEMESAVQLCHVITPYNESALASMGQRLTAYYDGLQHEAEIQFAQLMTKLRDELSGQKLLTEPVINYKTEIGSVVDVARNHEADQRLLLFVMATSVKGGFERFLAGSVSRDLIACSHRPVLLIPPKAVYRPFQTVVFASEMHESDLAVLNYLGELLRPFDSEIVLLHVTEQGADHVEETAQTKHFLDLMRTRTKYTKIVYRQFNSHGIQDGLEWFGKEERADLLVVVHRATGNHGWFKKSHSQQLAKHTDIPLLVVPG